ncbi:Ail/Lom family outer membrane beta-barrel protein [Escherichia coli]|nr:Ail/Lom family outer membrane beta-barrel protein [Escherichia coli]EHP9686892.1 Ail/Lom family outer membrane beta-barrel protein [Escherichia coli]EHP9721856.1 Ail/Lom family outer membrane beta-barrel protein [Escherichia coli]EJN3623762.1 Ail/Lom family outer membrane beta-barrel protein [Escherichia coli]
MKRTIITMLIIFSSIVSWGISAKTGDITVSLGYAQLHAPGLKKFVKDANISGSNYFDEALSAKLDDDEYDATMFSGSDGKYKDPKGFNIKYRYEVTDNLGVIGAFTWAHFTTNGHVNANLDYVDPYTSIVSTGEASGKGTVKSNYWSFLVGPTLRANEYVSLYGMLGVALSEVSADATLSGKVTRTPSGKDTTAQGSDSFSYSKRKTNLAWSVGAQINPWANVAVDLAYEGSGSGDWRTSGVTAGIGLKF